MSSDTEETLQWMYSMLQETRRLYDQMEENLMQNKPVPVYEDLKHCRAFIDELLNRVVWLAIDVHKIKLETWPYGKRRNED